MEKYLNELHAEVEYRLRCSIERTKEKNLMEVEYEAKLLELLVEVIDRKNYLIESKFDSSAIIEPKLMTKIKHDKESRQRMKKRLRKLKKRLIFTKESGRKSVE
ncbi:unnamed protein product [Dracunculus medinensis]|uniref:BMERB domain-containing protein n=1 Tax=Dracunculus medinensis TaxID=318479 RepID=A0A0N4U6P3_DRAME|nr:unnamed protein product [Dracunculus medinensis]